VSGGLAYVADMDGGLAILYYPDEFPGTGALADYRVSTKGCDVTRADAFGLAVTGGAGGSASVKIQRLKERPANTDDVAGKCLYLLDSPGVRRVDVTGNLAIFYTDAPVGTLRANDSVGAITTKNASVARIEVASTLDCVRMAALQGGTNVDWPVTRIASSGTQGQALAISLAGIVLEDLTTGQTVKSLSVASKVVRVKTTGAWRVTTGGVGRIAPTAVADTSGSYKLVASGFGSIAAKGALIRPDELVSYGMVGKITGKSLSIGGATCPAMLGWEGEPERMLMKAENFVLISADSGVHGKFWVGFDAQGPTYAGTVGTVATKAGTGTLSGELRVAPGTLVKFKPDQGDMQVLTSD
jgi:hypothetical protein